MSQLSVAIARLIPLEDFTRHNAVVAWMFLTLLNCRKLFLTILLGTFLSDFSSASLT